MHTPTLVAITRHQGRTRTAHKPIASLQWQKRHILRRMTMISPRCMKRIRTKERMRNLVLNYACWIIRNIMSSNTLCSTYTRKRIIRTIHLQLLPTQHRSGKIAATWTISAILPCDISEEKLNKTYFARTVIIV